jgi:hypothetical protein
MLCRVPLAVIKRFGEWDKNEIVLMHYLRNLAPQGLLALAGWGMRPHTLNIWTALSCWSEITAILLCTI